MGTLRARMRRGVVRTRQFAKRPPAAVIAFFATRKHRNFPYSQLSQRPVLDAAAIFDVRIIANR
jgi:hypothetical protein